MVIQHTGDPESKTVYYAIFHSGKYNKTISPFTGIRIKPFTEDKHRGVRTLDLFLSILFEKTGDALPPNCGAITGEEATATGLKLEEIRSRSFYQILEGRRRSNK